MGVLAAASIQMHCGVQADKETGRNEPPDREATLWDTAPYGRDILPLDSRPEQVLSR